MCLPVLLLARVFTLTLHLTLTCFHLGPNSYGITNDYLKMDQASENLAGAIAPSVGHASAHTGGGLTALSSMLEAMAIMDPYVALCCCNYKSPSGAPACPA